MISHENAVWSSQDVDGTSAVLYIDPDADLNQIPNYVPKIARNDCSEYRWVNRPQNDSTNAL